MKNTDFLGGSSYQINSEENPAPINSTDTSDQEVEKNKVHAAINDDEYYDDMQYDNDLMPNDEDEGEIPDNVSEESGLSELSNEELYF